MLKAVNEAQRPTRVRKQTPQDHARPTQQTPGLLTSGLSGLQQVYRNDGIGTVGENAEL